MEQYHLPPELIELDATEMAAINGGDGHWILGPDDVWNWIVDQITGPMKEDLEQRAP